MCIMLFPALCLQNQSSPITKLSEKKLGIDYLLKVILFCLYGATLVQANPTSNPEDWASLTVHQQSHVIDLKWSVKTQNQF